jgi:hypothetical protein
LGQGIDVDQVDFLGLAILNILQDTYRFSLLKIRFTGAAVFNVYHGLTLLVRTQNGPPRRKSWCWKMMWIKHFSCGPGLVPQ